MGVDPEIYYLAGLVAVFVLWPAVRLGAARPRRPEADRSRLDRATRALAPFRPRMPRRGPRLVPPRPAPFDPSPFFGRCWVVDGDSLEVDGKRIRMFGIDAPELSQDGGQAAKRHLIGVVARQKVRVVPRCIDCYGRIVARVWLGEIDLSDRMVRDGYAVAMPQFSRDYLPAERDARQKRRGRWHDDPVNGITDPTEHRRANPRSDARTARNCVNRA
jgi:endonuclease YncB( thermonuclease family)